MIQMFAHSDEVASLQALLPQTSGVESARILLALAWYLRQQDFACAKQFIKQLEPLIPDLPDPREQQLMRLRIELIEAESVCLNGQPDLAETMAQQILYMAKQQQDWLLAADAHWLLGSIAADVAQAPGRTRQRQLGQQSALDGGDSARARIAELSQAFYDVVSDPQSSRWDAWKDVDTLQLPPLTGAWVSNLQGLIAAQHGYSGHYWVRCFDLAMQTGQKRLAILTANNIADVLNELNDYESALEWNMRSLELARPTAWIGMTGMTLLQTGQTMRHLGRLDAAEDLFSEAIQMLAPLPQLRTHSIAMLYMGELALIQGKPAIALTYFERSQTNSQHLSQADFQLVLWSGQATALLRTGQPQAALVLVHRAWDSVRGMDDPKQALEVLKVLAEVYAHTEFGEPIEPNAYVYAGLPERNPKGLPPALIYLQMALELAGQIAGYIIDGTLYDALAEQYGRLGQFQQAYEMARQGGIAREKTHTAQATQSAIAAQVRYQTERAQIEGERERQLALEKAQHLAALQQTRTTLEHLESIGQEMTAQLDLDALYRILDNHLHQLLDIHVFAVYLLDSAGQNLVRAFCVEKGVLLPARRLSLNDPQADSVACFVQRRAVLRDRAPDASGSNHVSGTLNTLSALYVPLAVGKRVLGVMSVQSLQRHAFGEREQLIFHTLCAYAAIAFDNAHAYQQLLLAQIELAEQEKLAALGGLVAGVAHEMNTPLGNCLMIASSLNQQAHRLDATLYKGALARSDLNQFLHDSQLEIEILTRGLDVASTLISSFQQVAVDRSREKRQCFDLHDLCCRVEQALQARLQAAGIGLKLDLPGHWCFDSYPDALAQVLTQLIENAMQHAFSGALAGAFAGALVDGMPERGSVPQVCLQVRPLDAGWVRLQVQDNGIGIAPQQQKQVFEPFFTSQQRQGRCGLGLSVCHNIVSAVLGGHIGVMSVAEGACFYLDLPLVVSDVSAQ